jgi:hypothetical protein
MNSNSNNNKSNNNKSNISVQQNTSKSTIENNLLKASLIPMLSIKNIINGATDSVIAWVILLIIVGFIFIV